MADQSLIGKKVDDLLQWIGVSSTPSAAPTPQEEWRQGGTVDGWEGQYEEPATNPDVVRITAEITRIDARIQRLESDIDAANTAVRVAMAPYKRNHSKAPSAVRIKVAGRIKARKSHEVALTQAHDMRVKLETQIHNIENTAAQQGFVAAMIQTHRNMQGTISDVELRDAEDMTDDQRELEYRLAEYSSAVNGSRLPEIDDDELNDELEELLAEDATEAEALPLLPDPVSTAPVSSRHPRAVGAPPRTDVSRLADIL